jgi:hypothetical protein
MSPFAPSDKDGDILKLVLNWRELRQVALKREIHRLLSLLRDAVDVTDQLAVTASGAAADASCSCSGSGGGEKQEQQAEAAAAAEGPGKVKQEEQQGSEKEAEEEEKDEL